MEWISRLSGRLFPAHGPTTSDAGADVIGAIGSMGDDRQREHYVLEAAIDAGPAAVPHLVKALARYANSKRRVALWALAYLGGDEAIGALRDEVLVRASDEATAALCAALPSRATPDDRAFLIRVVESRLQGLSITGWQAVTTAALAIGILREEEAIPALEKVMRDAPGIPAHAARTAAQWIRRGPLAVDVTDVSANEAPILAAILANGIPRSDEAREFSDTERHGVWSRQVGQWSFRRSDGTERLPRMGLRIHQSRDSVRALVSAALIFGPANGEGYDYLLERRISWKVKGLVFRWIS